MGNKLINRTEIENRGGNSGQFNNLNNFNNQSGCSGCGERILIAIVGVIFFAIIGKMCSGSSSSSYIDNLMPTPTIEYHHNIGNLIPQIK